MTDEAQKETIYSNDLKIVTYSPPAQWNTAIDAVQIYMQAPQDVVPDLETLLEHLDTLTEKPDAIVIEDGSVPPAEGTRQEFLAAGSENNRCPDDKRHGVLALKALKNSQSAHKDIPVIIYRAFDTKVFLENGAAEVVLSADISERDALAMAVARAAKIEELAIGGDMPAPNHITPAAAQGNKAKKKPSRQNPAP